MYCKSPIIFDLLLSSSKPIWSIWTCCWLETLSRFTSSLGAWSFDGFSPVYSEKKGKETQIRVTSTILTYYVAQFPFFWLRRLRSQTPKSLESKGYADHLSPTATFLADNQFTDSCFNLSTTVTYVNFYKSFWLERKIII